MSRKLVKIGIAVAVAVAAVTAATSSPASANMSCSDLLHLAAYYAEQGDYATANPLWAQAQDQHCF